VHIKKYISLLLFGLYHNLPVSFEESIYNRDWDVLILLDSCRADSLRHVAPEYPWIPDSIPTMWSVGSMSDQWMDNTFTDLYVDQMSDTVYVTGNPFSQDHIDQSQFASVDEVWRDSWDYDVGTVPAGTMTERAVSAHQKRDPDRLIIHYMQPHFPSIPDPLDSPIPIEDFGNAEPTVWDDVRSGRISVSRARESYLENLRYVLDAVSSLRQNIGDKKTIISADHGECFGEWGFYGHMPNKPIPAVRRVPWAEIETSNSGELEPDTRMESRQHSEIDIDEKLKSLGYK
jgi:hypothetical protein